MKHLRKFLYLPVTEWWLLLKAALLLEVIKLGMRLLPFRTLRRLAARAAATRRRHVGTSSADRIAWIVEVASRHTPGVKTCLAQALAAQVLLARRGHPTLLRIGVVKDEKEQFQAHAWVESGGKTVIGGYELDRYTTLATLGTDSESPV